MSPVPAAVLTPCTGVCTLDARGLCDGCNRTIEEIANWASLDEARRLYLMDVVLPRRADRA